MIEEITLIEKAARIMAEAHANQKRKNDNSPFIVHPVMVALKLAKFDFQDAVIAAALVHDVLEDTDFSEEKLLKILGGEVVEIVKVVTENKSLPWEDRKKLYIEAVKNGSVDVKAISICDKIHNLEDVLAAYQQIGSEIWKKFNRGKEKQIWLMEETLKMFKESWRHPLIDGYEILVLRAKKLK